MKIKYYFMSAVIILNTLFSIGVFAEEKSDDNVLFSLDFEKYDGSLTSETGFDEIVGSSNYPTIIDEEHGTSYGTTTTSVSRAKKDLDSVISEGVYYLSFDTYKSKKADLTYIRLGNQDYKGYSANSLYETFLMNDSVISFYKNTKGWSIDSAQLKYETNRWYNIGMWFDFNERRVMYYVDGELLGSSGMNAGLTGIKCVWFISESGTGLNLAAFDNIFMTKVDLDEARRLDGVGVTVPEYIKNPIGLSISSQEIGHIFTGGTAPEFDVEYRNKDSADVRFDAQYTVKNSRGETVWTNTEAHDVEGGGSKTVKVQPDVSEFDIYTLNITTETEDGSVMSKTIEVSIANTPSKDVKNYKYGMCMHTNKGGRTSVEEGLPTMGKIGTGFVREDFAWGNYETQKGVYGFNGSVKQYYDKWFEYLEKENLKPLLIWGGTNSAAGTEGGTVPRNKEGLEALEAAAYHFASEYKGRADYFEFTNEPDFNRQEAMSCAEYATALQYFYRGIKRGNPDAVVLAGGTSRANHGWLEGVLKEGGYGYCDAVSCHPYQGQNSPESGKWVEMAGAVKDMLKKNGWDDIEVWVTEANTSSGIQYNTAEGQGWNLVRHYALIDAYDVVDTFISYQFQTNEFSKTDNEAWFGTVHGWSVDNAYGAKPAFMFASNYFAMTEGASFEKILQYDNTYILQYKKEDGTSVFMMYVNRDAEQVTLDLGSESGILYDKYGNPTEIFGIDGNYTFTLDDAPIYFETKAERFELSQDEKIHINSVYEELPVGQTAVFKVEADIDADIDIKAKDNYEVVKGENNEFYVTMKERSEVFDYESRNNEIGMNVFRDYAELTVHKDGRIYASMNLSIGFVESQIDGSIKIMPYSDNDKKHWKNEIKIKNNNTEKEVSGTLTFESPKLMSEVIAPRRIENLKPGEETVIYINIPTELVNSSQLYEAVFTIDDGEEYKFYAGDCARSSHYNQPKALTAKSLNKAKEETIIDGVINEEEWDGYRISVFDKSEVNYGSAGLVIDGVVERPTFGADADYGGKDDFAGEIYAKWDEDFLYVAAIVKDDVYYQKEVPVRLYLDDCFYVVSKNALTQRHDTRIDMAMTEFDGNTYMFTNWTPLYDELAAGIIKPEIYGNELKVVRKQDVTIYEGKIPWRILIADEKAEKYTNVYLSFNVRDYDGDRDKSYNTGGWYCFVDYK